MSVNSIMFSVNSYDKDGDIEEEGIFLHFEGARVKAASTMKDFRGIVDHFEALIREIEENYPEAK